MIRVINFIFYDIKINSDDLILKLCNLKYTVIHKDEVKTIYKRNSGLSIICIYESSALINFIIW